MNDTNACQIIMKEIAFAPFVEMDKELITLFKQTNILETGYDYRLTAVKKQIWTPA